MNFQLYPTPGLMPAGAVPVYGATPSPLVGQQFLPRGMMQGGVRPLLGQPIAMRPQMGQMQMAQMGQFPRQPGMFPRQPMMRPGMALPGGMAGQLPEGTDEKRTPSPGDQKVGALAGGIPGMLPEGLMAAHPFSRLPPGFGLEAMGGTAPDPSMGLLGAPPGLHPAMITGVHMEAALKEETYDDGPVMLDTFNADLNLELSPDGFSAQTLNNPKGFCFCWGGVRATHGVTSGKVCFEVQVTEELATDFGSDHKEQDPHVVRVGWSVDSHSLQLGEDADSYGYGGTGRFSDNCKFRLYGETYGMGDVMLAIVDFTARPPTISYCKNGHFLGVAAHLSRHPPGQALFPHVLSKNCRVHINFGQRPPTYPVPQGCTFIAHLSPDQRVRAMRAPSSMSECEIIMAVGLPGSGKTTWCLKMQKENFDKRYNIIGTDTLIDKMKVMGLPRKNNYHGRWDALISMASACLNKLFSSASKQCRNYILDQTNVYPSARKRKMNNFKGFKRIFAVIQPDDSELKRREWKRTNEDGKFVPESAVMEMKANYTLPEESDHFVDEIRYIELNRADCANLIRMYRDEGQRNRPSREVAFPHEARNSRMSPATSGMGPSSGGPLGRHGSRDSGYSSCPPEKKPKTEQTSALDFIKQEYEEPQAPDPHAIYQHPWQQSVKQEPRERPGEYDSARGRMQPSGGYGGQRSLEQGQGHGIDLQGRKSLQEGSGERRMGSSMGYGAEVQGRGARSLWDQENRSSGNSGLQQVSLTQGSGWWDRSQAGSRNEIGLSSTERHSEQRQHVEPGEGVDSAKMTGGGQQTAMFPWQQGQLNLQSLQQQGGLMQRPPWQQESLEQPPPQWQRKQQEMGWPAIKQEKTAEQRPTAPGGRDPFGLEDDASYDRGQDSQRGQFSHYPSDLGMSEGNGRGDSLGSQQNRYPSQQGDRGYQGQDNNKGRSGAKDDGMYDYVRKDSDSRFERKPDSNDRRGYGDDRYGVDASGRGQQSSRGRQDTLEDTPNTQSQRYGHSGFHDTESSRNRDTEAGYGSQREPTSRGNRFNEGGDRFQDDSRSGAGTASYDRFDSGSSSNNRGRGGFDSRERSDARSSSDSLRSRAGDDRFKSADRFSSGQSRDSFGSLPSRDSFGGEESRRNPESGSTRDRFVSRTPVDRFDSSQSRDRSDSQRSDNRFGRDDYSPSSARDRFQSGTSRDHFDPAGRFDSGPSKPRMENRSRGPGYEDNSDSGSGKARFESRSSRPDGDSQQAYHSRSQQHGPDSFSGRSPYDSRSRYDSSSNRPSEMSQSKAPSLLGSHSSRQDRDFSPSGNRGQDPMTRNRGFDSQGPRRPGFDSPSMSEKASNDKPKKRSRWGPSEDLADNPEPPRSSPRKELGASNFSAPTSAPKPGLGLLGAGPKPSLPASLLASPPPPPPPSSDTVKVDPFVRSPPPPSCGQGLLGAAPPPPPGPDQVGAKPEGGNLPKSSLLGAPPKSLLPTPEPSDDTNLSGRSHVEGGRSQDSFNGRGGFGGGRGGFPPGGPLRGRGGGPPRGSMGMGQRGGPGMNHPPRGGFGQHSGGGPGFGGPRGFNPRPGAMPSGVRSLFDSPIQRPRGMGMPMRGGPPRGGFPQRF